MYSRQPLLWTQSRRSLGTRFRVVLRILCCPLCIKNAAPAFVVAATPIPTSVYFAVEKLGEIDYEILVLARSKREVENALNVDRFYEHLQYKSARSSVDTW